MNGIKGLLSISFLFVALGVCAQDKVKPAAKKDPSVMMAMDIKNSIGVPLAALEKKNTNPLVKELATITNDLFKLAYNKIATKYDAFKNACKSFEPGLEESEFKFAYLESWIDLVNKRIRKLGDYKARLAKIEERLAAFDKKLESADVQLRTDLEGYSSKLKEKIALTNTWLEKSNTLFAKELNKLTSREKAFIKAGVPRA